MSSCVSQAITNETASLNVNAGPPFRLIYAGLASHFIAGNTDWLQFFQILRHACKSAGFSRLYNQYPFSRYMLSCCCMVICRISSFLQRCFHIV